MVLSLEGRHDEKHNALSECCKNYVNIVWHFKSDAIEDCTKPDYEIITLLIYGNLTMKIKLIVNYYSTVASDY